MGMKWPSSAWQQSLAAACLIMINVSPIWDCEAQTCCHAHCSLCSIQGEGALASFEAIMIARCSAASHGKQKLAKASIGP